MGGKPERVPAGCCAVTSRTQGGEWSVAEREFVGKAGVVPVGSLSPHSMSRILVYRFPPWAYNTSINL